MSTGVDKILQQMGGSPEKNKTGVDKILEILESGGGGSSLPSYTSADIGKVLTVVEGESAEQTVIPEQTHTLDASGGMAEYYFTNADSVNIDFFKNVSVGDTCKITINGVEETCTAADYMGASLFETTGNYLVGYDPVQNICGIVNMSLFESVTLTVSATASLPSATAAWENVGSAVTITLPNELNTLLMSTLQSRAPAAIAAEGMPSYNGVGSYSTATDLDALNALYTEIINARSEGRVLRLSGGTLVTETTYDNGTKIATISFGYKMFVYSTYVFKVDLEIQVNAEDEYDNYGIRSVITLVS